ncbi:AlbA family DNA-binding domain-containing protein [Govanella unica]|uniref:ATP-binding protein n=1 Tax=Govanella unica TaxID=2975056 RepID=A0A9X3Z6P3_9PROT|nr:ATP-binding protein [Govania unica]MDA5193292.1 ATP-binding protein [Govania unica]
MVRQRSITDKEIALIKAMCLRGMMNKDIQFFFNRPERPVNSGRITDIKNGTYSEAANISPVDDNALDKFLKSFQQTETLGTVVTFEGRPSTPVGAEPMSKNTLSAMFEKNSKGIWHFKYGESEKHECKENFTFRHSGKWLRAVAALANNMGGYIVFGVKDKKIVLNEIDSESYKVAGVNSKDFQNADPADFTKIIKSTFDPTPKVETGVFEIEGANVGVMYVHQHGSRPIIALKGDGEFVKEGDIFFRYPGQSARIKYSDLRTILDERDRQAREQMLPMVAKLLQLGPRGAMVADLATGLLIDEQRSIIIGEDLLDQIKFIREGEFDEKAGEPTLKLIGEVKILGDAGSLVRKGFATPTDLINDFLEGSSPYDPKDYIRCAVEVGNGAWLPMHFYGAKAGLDSNGLAEFIKTTKATEKRMITYVERALGKNGPYQKATGGALAPLENIKAGRKVEPKTAQEALDLVRAITGLEERPAPKSEDLLQILKNCWGIVEINKPRGLGVIRRAIARVDELYFAGYCN